MSEPKGYVDPHYLQVAALLMKQTKERSYTLMRIQPGGKVLDVGCGPGADTIPLAQWVGATGQVVGVDYDAAMVREADQHAREAGVSGWVKHKQADAAFLPFETGTFDACRSERLFQHLLNPAQALSEMARVTKSGGWIVVLDTDWGAASVDTSEVDIERRLARVRAERTLHNGYAGRQLYRLFKRQNLLDISIEGYVSYTTSCVIARLMGVEDVVEQEALSAGLVTPEEIDRYHFDLEQADAAGVFFASDTGIMLAGRKP